MKRVISTNSLRDFLNNLRSPFLAMRIIKCGGKVNAAKFFFDSCAVEKEK